jgi:hypothetical protein
MNPGSLVFCISVLHIESSEQCADSRRKRRHFLTNILQKLVVFGSGCKCIEFTSSLLKFRVEDMTVALEDVQQLRLDFGENVHPFDVSGK